jgi:hypothetical protein
VTVNLATALHDLRHPQNVLRLWADAICLSPQLRPAAPSRDRQRSLFRQEYQNSVLCLYVNRPL